MLMSQSKIVELTGFSVRRVKAAAESLQAVVDGRRHLYDTREILPVLYAGPNGPHLDLNAERAKLAKVQAEVQELKKRQLAGDLVDAETVVADWLKLIGIAKGRLLAMPSRLTPELVRLSSLREVEESLVGAIHEVMKEIEGDVRELTD